MARDTQGSPADEKKLEQYGVWVKVKPRDVTTAPILEESFGLSDLESPRTPARAGKAGGESALTAEEEKLLDELETELEPAVPEEEPLLDDAELPEIDSAAGRTGSSDLESEDDELPELEEELEPPPRAAPKAGGRRPAEVEVTLSEDAEAEDHFDDLAALENELASVTTRTSEAPTSSAEILARIEDELRSIRSDLNQLRHDLSGLRKTAAEGAGEGPSAQAGAQSGFFDEDEDEAIALTGDELDNILNTAEITEETAETPGAGADMDLMGESDALDAGGTGDVLSFDTPTPEAVEMPALSEDLDMVEDAEPADDTLVLTDDDLLPTAGAPGGSAAATDDDLPADLVLEELATDDDSQASGAEKDSSDVPEIDLEEIPEMESEPEIAPALRADSAMDDEGSETIDLETLDLGEEPRVIDAVPEQVEEVEDLQDAEEVLELDEGPVAKPAGKKARQQPDEVDLEALAAEAEELEDDVPAAPVVEDLEIGELESMADEAGGIVTPQKEIEIDFEADLADDVETLPASEEDETASAPEEVSEPARSAEPSEGDVPDNLRDELRTVLTYMDHLLEALPDEKIQEFASSEYFVRYKKLFEDLGLGE